MDSKMTLGEQIRYYRERAGLTKSQLAEEFGVSPATIGFWEENRYNPTVFNLTALAETLGCQPADLLSFYRLDCEEKLFDEEHMENKLKEWTAAMPHAKKALFFAKEKHSGQFKDGPMSKPGNVPYIYHPYNMACQAFALGIADDTLISAVFLHDVVEDCGVSVVDLTEENGGSPEIRETVRLVTKQKGSYDPDAYYEGIKGNKYACMVKLLDRCSNLSSMPTTFDRARMAKYVIETEEYIIPLLSITKYIPEWYNATYLLNYQMRSLLTTCKAFI